MLSPLFSLFSALFLVLSYLANAAPIDTVELLAFAPTIKEPNAKSLWIAGSSGTVRWETDNIPTLAKNYTLTILLGRIANGSENLDIKNPLASRIPIKLGSISVPVPVNATPDDNYVVAVIGDSGDISQQFGIVSTSYPSVA